MRSPDVLLGTDFRQYLVKDVNRIITAVANDRDAWTTIGGTIDRAGASVVEVVVLLVFLITLRILDSHSHMNSGRLFGLIFQLKNLARRYPEIAVLDAPELPVDATVSTEGKCGLAQRQHSVAHVRHCYISFGAIRNVGGLPVTWPNLVVLHFERNVLSGFNIAFGTCRASKRARCRRRRRRNRSDFPVRGQGSSGSTSWGWCPQNPRLSAAVGEAVALDFGCVFGTAAYIEFQVVAVGDKGTAIGLATFL